MAIITFVNNRKEETGKSMSMVAIATHMAIEKNEKILIISTSTEKDRINSCYFEEKKRFRLFGKNTNSIETESGVDGLAKIIRSNKLSPEIITNYTKVVFKDRLEILLASEKMEEIAEEYVNLISMANMYYDKIFVDLDYTLDENIRQGIIEKSNLVIVNTSQNLSSLKELKENKQKSELLQSPKTLLLIGRYDKFSKYNVKNVTRFLGEKNQILTVPYNTLYFEAANEASVPDLFLKLRKLTDVEDRNMIFISEVNRAMENIVYRLQELQTIM